MASWSNWAGNVVAQPRQLETPDTVEQARKLVAGAARRGLDIRVAGSGHSFAPICASDGLLLDFVNIAGIESIDANGEAVIMAGSKIYDLGQPLFEAGWAFANQGDIDRQAI